jgi:hypothetical protein
MANDHDAKRLHTLIDTVGAQLGQDALFFIQTAIGCFIGKWPTQILHSYFCAKYLWENKRIKTVHPRASGNPVSAVGSGSLLMRGRAEDLFEPR